MIENASGSTENSLDIIEGRNPISEALKSGRSINKILVAKGSGESSLNKIVAQAKAMGVVVQMVDRMVLDKVSVTHAHQGIIAHVAARDYVDVDYILKVAEDKGEPPFIIMLDEITDPYNLGSVLRTADAVGAHGVIIPKRRAVGLNASVSKASAGAIEYVPVAQVNNLVQTIDYLKGKEVWVGAVDASAKTPFYKGELKGALALVVGSEGGGIRDLVLKNCDFVVGIPMMGSVSSLNAAVAAGIVMYEALKQRDGVKQENRPPVSPSENSI